MDAHRRIKQRVRAEHQAIADRLRVEPEAVLDYARGNVARWSKDYDSARRPDWLVEWQRLLTGPVEALVVALTADTETAVRLRASSPFLGLLTFRERLEILRRVDPELAKAMETFETNRGQHAHDLAELARR
ncbi:MAG: hypothetical protein WCC36_00700 [Gammaproteobacteria bacterium]